MSGWRASRDIESAVSYVVNTLQFMGLVRLIRENGQEYVELTERGAVHCLVSLEKVKGSLSFADYVARKERIASGASLSKRRMEKKRARKVKADLGNNAAP